MNYSVAPGSVLFAGTSTVAAVGHLGDVAGVAVDVVVDSLETAVGEFDEVPAGCLVAVACLRVAVLGFCPGSSPVATLLTAAASECPPCELVLSLI